LSALLVDFILPGQKSLLEEHTVGMEGTVDSINPSQIGGVSINNHLPRPHLSFAEKIGQKTKKEFDDYTFALDKLFADPAVKNELTKFVTSCLEIQRDNFSSNLLKTTLDNLPIMLAQGINPQRFNHRSAIEHRITEQVFDLLR
jgi:hypothetical protein